jgi:NAD(P)-dependent dehydrogenase (short-subunit alcohol dehydrogenase family)
VSFEGQGVVVTGGAGSIGAEISRAFAAAGARVHLLDRDGEVAERRAAAIRDSAAVGEAGGTVHAHAVDITDEREVDATMDVVAAAGGIRVLVNNAGIAIRDAATELSLEAWNAVLAVNQTGVFLCARAAARHMRLSGGGAVVNIASIMGLRGGGLYPNISYQASKGAVVNMTRALAVEWAPDDIRVNAVAPTWVKTDLTKALFDRPEMLDRMLAITPLGRLAEAEDVAAAVLFLSSDAARMITGHVLAVDGGLLAS